MPLTAAPVAGTGRRGQVLDDHDSRPGSATSLLRTFVGCYLRRLDGWVPAAVLPRLLGDLGVSPGQARTALMRVRRKGLLEPVDRDGVGGYALAAAAVPMLERGDRRIYHPRSMRAGEPWCLLSFTVPEAQRDLRHQLRRRLSWIGAGTVSSGLWILPGHRVAEVEQIVADLGVGEGCTLFLGTDVRLPGTPRDAARAWWDLAAVAGRHQAFLDAATRLDPGPEPGPAAAFAGWLTVLDLWRVIPYVDPGLPPDWLPPDWPGGRSAALFADLRDRWQELGLAHARAAVVEKLDAAHSQAARAPSAVSPAGAAEGTP